MPTPCAHVRYNISRGEAQVHVAFHLHFRERRETRKSDRQLFNVVVAYVECTKCMQREHHARHVRELVPAQCDGLERDERVEVVRQPGELERARECMCVFVYV